MTPPPPPHFVTFSAFLPPSSETFPLPIDCTDLPAHTVTYVSASPTRFYKRPSSRIFSTCFVLSARSRVCVFTAAWLHIPDISFFAIHMGPSSVRFSTLFVVSAHSRVCMFLCLSTPAWLHLPDISIFAIATHYFSRFTAFFMYDQHLRR
jgi:hypothetical protein